ncbi:MAG: hypothetical protein ACQES4_02210 [Bacillota bacterium]
MEGIIALIILVIIFNIFNYFARALKGNRSDQRHKVLFEKKDSGDEFFEQTDSGWAIDEKPDGSFLDMRQSTGDYQKMEKTSLGDETAIPPVNEVKSKSAKKRRSSSNLSGNLRELLTKKDPLLTAFIFHEIFDPPRARRRKL